MQCTCVIDFYSLNNFQTSPFNLPTGTCSNGGPCFTKLPHLSPVSLQHGGNSVVLAVLMQFSACRHASWTWTTMLHMFILPLYSCDVTVHWLESLKKLAGRRKLFQFIRMEKRSNCLITAHVRVKLAVSLVYKLSPCSDRDLFLSADSQTS